MSEELNETLNIEELSNEQKKKAINLQDLIYVKKYIDANHYSKAETDSMLESMVDAEIEDQVKAHTYTKNEINEFNNNRYTKEEVNEFNANRYTKEEIDANHYTKTEIDDTFCKKADGIDNAKKINGLEIKNDSAGVLTNGDYIIPQKKLLASPSIVLSTSLDAGNLGVITTANNTPTFQVKLKLSMYGTNTSSGYVNTVVSTKPFKFEEKNSYTMPERKSTMIYSEKFKMKNDWTNENSFEEIEVGFYCDGAYLYGYLLNDNADVKVTALKIYEVIE